MQYEKHKIPSLDEIKSNRMKSKIEMSYINKTYHLTKSWLQKSQSLSVVCIVLIFSLLAFVSLPDAIKGGTFIFVSWIAQTFLQLVLLPIIMVGQKVESKKTELKANQDFEINKKHELENEAILKHLENQNRDILAILKQLKKEKQK